MDLYHPPQEFVARANVPQGDAHRQLMERAESDPEAFWGGLAESELHWFRKWDKGAGRCRSSLLPVVHRWPDQHVLQLS